MRNFHGNEPTKSNLDAGARSTNGRQNPCGKKIQGR